MARHDDSWLYYRVDAAENVVIGDSGLARDIYHDDYYQSGDQKRPLPIKWMAYESIENGRFSTKSDVVGRTFDKPFYSLKWLPLLITKLLNLSYANNHSIMFFLISFINISITIMTI